MKRRNFLYTAGLTSLGLTLSSFESYPELKKKEIIRGTFSQKNNQVSIFTKARVTPIRVFQKKAFLRPPDTRRNETYRSSTLSQKN